MDMKNLWAALAAILSLAIIGSGRAYAGAEDHSHHSHDMHEHHAAMPSGPEPVVDMETLPAEIMAGTPATITFTIRDNDGKPVRDLAITHDRIVHVVIISEDLSVFGHIHAEDSGPITQEMKENAWFPVRYTFPKAGKYNIAVDFAYGGRGYSELLDLDVGGGPAMGSVQKDLSHEKDVGGYLVKLTTSPEAPAAGKETTLRYTFMKNGQPVADIEPYLSAAMHLAVINEGMQHYFVHAHGDRPGAMHHMGHEGHMATHMGHSVPAGTKFGPEIEANVVFPVKGTYKIFSEIQHDSKVLLIEFMVDVR